MAQSQETQVNLKINRVPSKSVLDNMVANNQLQPNQLYMIESEQGDGLVALQTKTLWTNPNPTSAFAAQSITALDMSEYDYLMFIFLNTASSTNTKYTQILKYSNTGRLFYGDTNGTAVVSRNFTFNSGTSISFANARYKDGDDNSDCIPYQIIGIKLVNSQAEVTNVYSTSEEVIVGRWIDGKKIYRKVVDMGTNFTVPTTVTTITGNNLPLISEVGTIINVKTLVYENDVCVACDPCQLARNSSDWRFMALDSWNGTSTRHVYIILEYTKTTD